MIKGKFTKRTGTFFRAIEKKRSRLLWTMFRKVRALKIVVASAAVFVLFVLPPAYAAHGYVGGVLPGVKLGLVSYLIGLPLLGFTRALIMAICMGYGMSIIGDEPPDYELMSENAVLTHLFTLLSLFSFVLTSSITLASRGEWMSKNRTLTTAERRKLRPDKWEIIVPVCISAVLFLVAGIWAHQMSPEQRVQELWHLKFLGALFGGGIFGIVVGVMAGNALRVYIGPGVSVFREIFPYLKAMFLPAIGFFVGYLLIAFLFANCYWAVWRANKTLAFVSLPQNPMYGDFFYFSIVTISTLGYGDISPSSALARTLVGGEVVLGMGWCTIVLAAVIAHLQPRFANIKSNRDLRRRAP